MSRDELIEKMGRAHWSAEFPTTPWERHFREPRSAEMEALKRAYLDYAAVGLDAVDHLIRADALTEAAYELDKQSHDAGGPMTIRNAVQWLCDRAEELEKGTKG